MTDTSTLDEYNRRQEAKRNPLEREIVAMFTKNMADHENTIKALSPYEPWTDRDREIWLDRQDKLRVFWADHFELALERELFKDSWLGAILLLHQNVDGKCEGCDFSGYEGEPPDWPCRTVFLASKFPVDYVPQFENVVSRLKKKPESKGNYVTYQVYGWPPDVAP